MNPSHSFLKSWTCENQKHHQIQVPAFYQTYPPATGSWPRGWAPPQQQGNLLSGRSKCQGYGRVCIFFQVFKSSTFENSKILRSLPAIFQKKRISKVRSNTSYIEASKIRMTMLLSFHVFSIKNWHPTSLIVVIQLYINTWILILWKHHSILIFCYQKAQRPAKLSVYPSLEGYPFEHGTLPHNDPKKQNWPS